MNTEFQLKMSKQVNKGQQKTSSEPLALYLESQRLSQVQFARYLGVTPSCVSHWISDGEMPVYMERHLEALQELKSKRKDSSEKSERTLVLSGKSKDIGMVEGLAAGLGLRVVEL